MTDPHKDNLFRVELESFAVTVLIPSDFLQVYKYVLSGPQNLPRLGCITMQDVLWDDSRAFGQRIGLHLVSHEEILRTETCLMC